MAVRSGLVTTRISSMAYRNDVVERPMPAPVSTSTTSARSPTSSMAATRRRRRLGCRSAISGLPDPPPASRTPIGPVSAMSSMLAPLSITSITVRRGCSPRSRCRFASPMSASTAMTRSPDATRWTARLLVRTDFPVPPLPLVTQTTTGRGHLAPAWSLTSVSSWGFEGEEANGEAPRSYSPRPSRRRVNTSSSRRSPAVLAPLPLEALKLIQLFVRQSLERARGGGRVGKSRARRRGHGSIRGRGFRLHRRPPLVFRIEVPGEALLRGVRPRHFLIRGRAFRPRGDSGRWCLVHSGNAATRHRVFGWEHPLRPERLPIAPVLIRGTAPLDHFETEERRRGLDDGQTRAAAAADVARQAGGDLDRQKGQPPQESARERRSQKESTRPAIAL